MQQKTTTILLLLILLTGLVACGSSGGETTTTDGTVAEEGSVDETAVEQLPDLIDEEAMDTLPTSTPEPTSNTSTENDNAETSDEADVNAEEGNASIDFDPARQQINEEGLEVGFTYTGHAYIGNPNAPVVIEEFSDYQCPFCGRFASQTMPTLLANQIANGDAVLVFYDFPLTSIHPQGIPAALAANCVGEQSAIAYWEMHDLLFANIPQWQGFSGTGVFTDYAKELDINMNRYEACIEAETHLAKVESDLNIGQSRGVSSTPSFFVNGRTLVGAQPIVVFDQVITSALTGEPVAEAPSNNTGQQPQQPQETPTPAPINYESYAAVIGSPDAPVTIVEYTDYQCPFCSRHSTDTLPSIVSQMIETGRVRYYFKDFPLDNIHPEARTASVAARCAGEQEAYVAMHDAIFNSQSQWGGQGIPFAQEAMTNLATDLQLDIDEFSACLTSGRYDDAVEADLQEGLGFGIRGTPSFFIDGFPIQGAQPFELFEFAVGLAEEGELASAYAPAEQPPQQAPPQPAQQDPRGIVEVPLDGSAFAIGDENAPITIVEYTDFQCPFCGRHTAQTYPLIKENYIDQGLVRYIFKDFPLTQIHPQAPLAHEAARCAGDQGAYLGMHELLFANQQQWGNAQASDMFKGYASDLGLDTAVFNECLDSGKYTQAVEANFNEGANFGVRGTPAFFVNGNPISGAQPYQVFEQAISTLLQEDGE